MRNCLASKKLQNQFATGYVCLQDKHVDVAPGHYEIPRDPVTIEDGVCTSSFK